MHAGLDRGGGLKWHVLTMGGFRTVLAYRSGLCVAPSTTVQATFYLSVWF